MGTVFSVEAGPPQTKTRRQIPNTARKKAKPVDYSAYYDVFYGHKVHTITRSLLEVSFGKLSDIVEPIAMILVHIVLLFVIWKIDFLGYHVLFIVGSSYMVYAFHSCIYALALIVWFAKFISPRPHYEVMDWKDPNYYSRPTANPMNWNPIVLMIFSLACIYVTQKVPELSLFPALVPLTILMLFFMVVPGLGTHNSVWNLVTLIFLAIMSVLFGSDVWKSFTRRLVYVLEPNPGASPTPPLDGAYAVALGLNNIGFEILFNSSYICDILRVFIGHFIVFSYGISDFCGPGHLKSAAINALTKGPPKVLNGISGVFDSPFLVMLISELIVKWVAGGTTMILIMCLSGCIAFATSFVDTRVWEGDGENLAVKDVRRGEKVVLGSGVKGYRTFQLFISCAIAGICLLSKSSSNLALVFIFVSMAGSLIQPRWTMMALGLVTLNLGMITYAWQCTGDPTVASLRRYEQESEPDN